MSDSFLVFFDFDIFSTIKRKNPFGFDFKFVAFDFSNNTFHFQSLLRLISQLHFWFLKFDAFDFWNDTFDFQNLWRLISQMTLEFEFQNFTISITKRTLMFSQFVEYALWNAFLIINLFPIDILNKCLISKIRSFDFPNGVSDFENSIMR